jgi:hypothetical protein
MYLGDYKEGQKTGKGLESKNERLYYGEFLNGKQNGQGILIKK